MIFGGGLWGQVAAVVITAVLRRARRKLRGVIMRLRRG